MIYLVCFAVSVLFAYLANKTDKKNKLIIFSFISIALPVALAGLRGYSVGIDTMNYFTKEAYWGGAISADSLSGYFLSYFSHDYGDYLFAALLGITARLTGNYTVFLLLTHTIIMVGVYVGAFRHRKYANPALVLLVFYLFFYNHSLNTFRQYIAMSILFAFLADITEKKWWRYLIALIVAVGFHSTAIIGIAAPILYFILNFKKNTLRLSAFRREGIVTGLIALVVFSFKPIALLLIKTGLLNDRFAFFLKDDAVSPAVIISGIVVLGIVAAVYFIKPIRENCKNADFYIFNSLVYLTLLQLSFGVAYGKRIALYFGLADIITIGLVERAPTNPKIRRLVRIGIVTVALCYWLYVYLFRGASRTIPYSFVF